MNVISPMQTHRKLLAIPDKQLPSQVHLNEYALFSVLEQKRNKCLRDLYHGKTIVVLSPKFHGLTTTTQLLFPPQYQCLKGLSAECILVELKSNTAVSFQNGEQWEASIDRNTKTFLEDTVHMLRNYSVGNTRSDNINSSIYSSPPPLLHTSTTPGTTITPPSSPLTLPTTTPEDSITMVDITDEEIISSWNQCDIE